MAGEHISRDAAIEAALDYSVDVIENDYDRGYQKAVKDIAKELNSISAADVRPMVRGKWEDETGFIFNLLAQRVYCPNCKSHAYFYPITTKNYCPNCGCQMNGGKK